MGRRKRRKKVVLRPKRRIPKVFMCPKCGKRTVSIKSQDDTVVVVCGNCGLKYSFQIKEGLDKVDYYGKFVDEYYKEIEGFI